MNPRDLASVSNIVDLMPSLIAGRFEVIDCIGRGGVGVVLKCRDTVLNNIVAVKFLLNDVSDEEATRFQREAITAAKLNHRNIVRVVDFGQNNDGRLFLVMEYLEGGTLGEEVDNEGPYSVASALPIILKVCDGLIHAHKLGILHRDVKPSNVMLAREPNGKIVPKLVDFGLARFQKDEQQLTTGGRVFGSPSYLSPEVATGSLVDFRTDIYSLGCLIFETLAGTPPFLGETAFETLNQKISQKAPSLEAKTGKKFPQELEDILAHCLAVEPGNRYNSVQELKDDLESLYDLEEYQDFDIEEDSEELNITQTLVLKAHPDIQPEKRVNQRNIVIIGTLLVLALFAFFFAMKSLLMGEDTLTTETGAAKTLSKYKRASFFSVARDKGQQWSFFGGEDLEGALKELATKKSLRALRLFDQDLRGVDLGVFRNLKLNALSLNGCLLDDENLKEVSMIKDLQFLDCEGSEGFTASGLEHLRELKYLRGLDLQKTDVGDAVFDVVRPMPLLNELHLNYCHELEGKGMRKLAGVKVLSSLALGGAGINLSDPQALSFLQDCVDLKYLYLDSMPVSDQDLDFLKNLQLRKLYLSNTMITDEGLEKLSTIDSLRELEISRSYHVTNDGIKKLRHAMPHCLISR